jgi:hypothetical protein
VWYLGTVAVGGTRRRSRQEEEEEEEEEEEAMNHNKTYNTTTRAVKEIFRISYYLFLNKKNIRVHIICFF